MLKLVFTLTFIMCLSIQAFSTSLHTIAEEKIDSLQKLITKAESMGISTHKEKMTIRTSEVFLVFANYDEQHISENESYFKNIGSFKDNAAQLALDLADFERNEIIKMLDASINELNQLIDGEIFRTPSVNPDWADVTHDGDQLTYQGRPVFLADYTWKPEEPNLLEYFGQLDGVYLAPNQIQNENGDMSSWVLNNIKSKADGKAGIIFFGQTAPPQWALDKYGDELDDFTGEPFIKYDIDNPGAKDMITKLFAAAVPHMKGKQYTTLGYLLANEPRWITYKDGANKVWYNVEVSDYTKEKFKIWLEEKHKDISTLNGLWGTSFGNFSDVTIDIPIDISLIGTAKWYDWNTFNDYRATEWFKMMKAELLKHDPDAKVHVKIMPSFFTDNDPCTGIDWEAITELSDINGNDSSAEMYKWQDRNAAWKQKYEQGWRELFMGYDFLKSVRPNQINFNSEAHLLNAGYERTMDTKPENVRALYWNAHILGMTLSQTWYWLRSPDGSLNRSGERGIAGSLNQKPRVVNELHSTIFDLNAFSEEIMAMQRQRKPLRIFYSKTSAHQKHEYMNDVFDLYESLNFEGIPLGFATKNIISQQDNALWDAILVYKTERVTSSELEALQTYLDNGGTIITDHLSLKRNEYGISLPELNTNNGGSLVTLSSAEEIKTNALQLLTNKDRFPEVDVKELGNLDFKTCVWRCIKNAEGNNVLSITNLGKEDIKLNISLKNAQVGTACKDLIKGIPVASQPTLIPNQVYFIEVTDDKPHDVSIKNIGKAKSNKAQLFPNPSSGIFNIKLNQLAGNAKVFIYDINGSLISKKSYGRVDKITCDIQYRNNGVYLVKLITDEFTESFIYQKNNI